MTADVQRIVAVINDALSADQNVIAADPLEGEPAVLGIQMATGHIYYVEVTA